MEQGARDDREGFLDGFTTDLFSVDGELKVSEEQRQQAISLERQARDEAVVACVGAFGRTDFREVLDRVGVPTLVLHGDGDGVVPFEVSGEHTAQCVAHAEVFVLHGAPHGCNVSHADEFNQRLLDFLAR